MAASVYGCRVAGHAVVHLRSGVGVVRSGGAARSGGPRARDADIVTGQPVTWGERGRTTLWLETRLVVGRAVSFLTIHLPMLTDDLVRTVRGGVTVAYGRRGGVLRDLHHVVRPHTDQNRVGYLVY
ncbi:hypothetical protein OG613_47535 (plasmid) [Streptomyces sp. NBC_00015]|uniref:hypothetical protein n=1 Tax=Streptomyces sp. NBC_00015 TaxID=2903611 RepID=UPI00324C4069